MDLFSDDMRREPFPLYRQLRQTSPVLQAPSPFEHWMVFDYETSKRILSDHEIFSSAVPGPRNWFLFHDPPRHTKLRALITQAFTPRVVANLEPRIRELSRALLDGQLNRGEMDLTVDYAIPLPMMVIAEIIGIPLHDWSRFRYWSDSMLKLSYTMPGAQQEAEAAKVFELFASVTAEMSDYVASMTAERRACPRDDLLTSLVQAEVDGQKLSHDEILGFFQLLIVGGQETTANLINNAIICLLDNPQQLALVRERMDLLPSAIEEVLRYRSPLQWLMRAPTRDVELAGQTIPRGGLILVMIGSANRDEKQFADADRFDITRDPNPHVAFGQGIHFCMGAALSRLEARIALMDLLERLPDLSRANDEPWPPRQALHVHGPASLPVRFDPQLVRL